MEGMPPYNVVLLDDDEHSFEYVIYMLKKLFGHSLEKGYTMALEVDTAGRVVVATTHLEQAELKRDQIHAFGPDPLIPRCKGSMSAVIEPASG
jgi:ATP-dependent Clp protease adaptor protein ClpS